LNISNDSNLEDLRGKLKGAFSGLTAETLRQDKTLRDQKVDEVKAIESMMSSFMGFGAAKPSSTKMELKHVA